MKKLILLSAIGLLMATSCNDRKLATQDPTEASEYFTNEIGNPVIPSFMDSPLFRDPLWFLNPEYVYYDTSYKINNNN